MRKFGWKLTRNYTLFSVVAILLFELGMLCVRSLRPRPVGYGFIPVARNFKHLLGILAGFRPPPQGFGGFVINVLSWRNVVFIVAIAAVVGAIFGLLTARWLTRRLQRLALAAGAWGRGDFSVSLEDKAGDELSHLASQMNLMAAQLKNLMRDREQLAVLAERNRLALDLHDSVTQALYGLNLQAEVMAQQLAAGETEAAAGQLVDLRAAASAAVCEMRLLVFELRPPDLDEGGLAGALKRRLEAVEERTQVQVDFAAEEVGRLPAAMEEGLYRIAQEALNNALKHAEAGRIAVRLAREGDRIRLEIADDGKGFAPETARGGLGLAGMAERAAKMGGSLVVESAATGGTKIRMEVAVCPTQSGS